MKRIVSASVAFAALAAVMIVTATSKRAREESTLMCYKRFVTVPFCYSKKQMP